MRPLRLTIAGFMGLVLVAAVGMASLRSPSEARAGAMFLLTCGLLALAVVGVVCRGGSERAWWLGFALFGCGYMTMAFWRRATDSPPPPLPTTTVLQELRYRL